MLLVGVRVIASAVLVVAAEERVEEAFLSSLLASIISGSYFTTTDVWKTFTSSG